MTRLIQVLLVVGLLAIIAFGAKQQTYQAQEHRDSLHAWFLDVGQGDAIFLDTPERQQILIDGGPGSAVLSELSKVMPLGDKEIDLIIATHNDADHLKGLNDVLTRYKVHKVWLTGAVHSTQTYQRFITLLKDNNIPTEIITAGSKVSFGDLSGIAIWPDQNWLGQKPADQNAVGIVTFWQYGTQTLLMTGDIVDKQENQLLGQGLLRPVDILKVAHHGSRTSSTENFLRAVTPKIAIMSLGKTNSYGHPHPDVLARYQFLNIPVLRTDQSGRILCAVTLVTFSCNGKK